MTESAPTSALLRPHVPFRLAAFNVRTLMRIGQQSALARTLETLTVDVCCLSETRIQDPSTVVRLISPSTQEVPFNLRLSGDPEASASGQAGVGVALSARAEAALLDWIPVDSRLCAVRLKGSCRVSRLRPEERGLFVISAYAPTDCSPDAVKDRFYQNLHALLRRAPKSDVVILAGDLNARVGRLSSFEARLGGRFGLDGYRSDNGERLLNLCSDHRLFLASTNFRHTKHRTATWRSPSSTKLVTQIDHVAISYRWRGCIQDCRSYWTTPLESDHALVCAKVSMCFGGRPKPFLKRPDLSQLANSTVLSSYQSELATALASPPTGSIEGCWSRMKSAMNTASLNSCGLTRRVGGHWVSAKSLAMFDARRHLPADQVNDVQRTSLRQKLTASLREDREAWWSQRASEMEAAATSGNSRKLFHLIRATGPSRPCVSETICEADGSPIYNQQRRLERWAEHFRLQFDWPQLPAPLSANLAAPWDVSLSPPTEAEIRKGIQMLKRNKAPGSDMLAPALFKDGGDSLVRELTILFSLIWEEERVPSDWGESIIVPIFKKGCRNVCENHRGVSLTAVASKLMASIILHRLGPIRESLIREEQAGFRPNRGCIDQIFTLRQLLEHRHVYRRPTIVVFMDIRAAFDSIDRSALWHCLLVSGVPEKYVSILRALYYQTSGRVRAYGTLSPSFAVSNGVRQGCPISPFLFNFAMDDILNAALCGLQDAGVDLFPGDKVVDLEYADDIALLGENAQAIQLALNRLAMQASRYGMHFAPSKCKVIFQDWQGPVPALTIESEQLEQVDSFVYLGSCIAAGGSAGDEISSRIARARFAFANLRHFWRRHDIRLSLKGRVYNATVRAVLLYGCETWPLRAEDIRRLSVFDHRCLRSVARVWWQHHVSNAEVRRRVLGSDGRSLECLVSEHRMRWLGHVLRMPVQRLPRRALFALAGPGWKKERGGQSMTWCRGLKKLTESLARVGPSRLPGWGPKDGDCRWLETLRDMAQNRNQWRKCCRSVCGS